MIGKYDNIRIRGVVSTVPDHFVDCMDLTQQFGEKTVRKQIKVTGIKRRCVCQEAQRAADLCITSAKKLLDELNWQEDDISCLVFVSSYSSYRIPSTAFFIQKELGIGKQCLSFDVNLACSGFVAGLQIMAGLLQSREEGSKVILLVADKSSESVSREDKSASILFGDAGAAIAIEKKSGYSFSFLQKSDGNGYSDIMRVDGNHKFVMNGMGIFNFAINEVVDTIKEFFTVGEVNRDEIDYYFIHQAQKFIVDKVRAFSDFPEEKVPVTYDRFGNTGCASIPLTMCENKRYFCDKENTRIFMCAFGAGHSWGCATIDIDNDIYLATCYSNDIYLDESEK